MDYISIHICDFIPLRINKDMRIYYLLHEPTHRTFLYIIYPLKFTGLIDWGTPFSDKPMLDRHACFPIICVYIKLYNPIIIQLYNHIIIQLYNCIIIYIHTLYTHTYIDIPTYNTILSLYSWFISISHEKSVVLFVFDFYPEY